VKITFDGIKFYDDWTVNKIMLLKNANKKKPPKQTIFLRKRTFKAFTKINSTFIGKLRRTESVQHFGAMTTSSMTHAETLSFPFDKL
jgi:hypothetical protein